MVTRNIQKYIDRSEFIKEYFSYDPLLGKIFWMKRPAYSRIDVGDEAGCVVKTTGRHVVQVKKTMLYVHHVLWFLHYGYWPPEEIDHINNDRTDNDLRNLREATRLENSWNRRAHSKMGKGLKGAYRLKGERRWFGQIVIDGKQTYLGRFDTEEEAHAAYCEAARRHFGEFARAA